MREVVQAGLAVMVREAYSKLSSQMSSDKRRVIARNRNSRIDNTSILIMVWQVVDKRLSWQQKPITTAAELAKT